MGQEETSLNYLAGGYHKLQSPASKPFSADRAAHMSCSLLSSSTSMSTEAWTRHYKLGRDQHPQGKMSFGPLLEIGNMFWGSGG